MDYSTIDPVGGMGGESFGDYLLPEGTTLKEIHILSDIYIDAIQFVYADADGAVMPLPSLGGLGGVHNVIRLADDEYVIKLSGSYDWYIDQLEIETNKQSYGPYGGDGGSQSFALAVPEGQRLVGLIGRAAWYIDALGLITAPSAAPKKKKAAPKKAATKKKEPAKAKAKPKAKPAAKTTKSGQPKDLQKVEGIGPKIASLLIEDGILDLADLAKAEVAVLEAILKKAGNRYRMAKPETWPEQAALGAKGDWDGLKTLQESLKGGRRK